MHVYGPLCLPTPRNSFFERELIWNGGCGPMHGYGRCVVRVHMRMHVHGRVHRI